MKSGFAVRSLGSKFFSAVAVSVLTLALATPAAAFRCLVDTDGANDDPGQKDITQFCYGMGARNPFDLHTSINLDLTGVSGGNSADVCTLFDTDADGKVNLALCTTLDGVPAGITATRLFLCNDSSSDRCSGSVQVNRCTYGATCLADADCSAGQACTREFNTVCTAAQEATDPFVSGGNHPMDTVVACAIDLDEFGPAGASARLINAGAYPSPSPNSGTSDIILLPGCNVDGDCGSGEVCYLPSGECYVPKACTSDVDCPEGQVCNDGQCEPTGDDCTSDQDCLAGRVCNLATGSCEVPNDDGCTGDSDCAIGLSCDVASGECEPTGDDGCAVDADCPAGLVCDSASRICVTPDHGGCTTGADCADAGCNETTGNCGCVSDSDCEPGDFCNAGFCEPTDGTTTTTVPGGVTTTTVGDVTTTTVPGSDCVSNADCAQGEVCNGGVCEPSGGVTTTTVPGSDCVSNADCVEGEVCNGGVCEPSGGVTTTTLPVTGCVSHSDCAAGEVCDLDAGECVPSASCAGDAECEGLDSFCAIGFCDAGSQSCAVEPQNEGETCAPADSCTISNVCQGGACVATPLCDPVCSLCNGGECVSKCGNPHNTAGSGVTISDALFTLRAGVRLEECAGCVCDVNNNGRVTAVDALILERLVVRLPGTLDCSSSAD